MDELFGEKPWDAPLSTAGSHIADTPEKSNEQEKGNHVKELLILTKFYGKCTHLNMVFFYLK